MANRLIKIKHVALKSTRKVDDHPPLETGRFGCLEKPSCRQSVDQFFFVQANREMLALQRYRTRANVTDVVLRPTGGHWCYFRNESIVALVLASVTVPIVF